MYPATVCRGVLASHNVQSNAVRVSQDGLMEGALSNFGQLGREKRFSHTIVHTIHFSPSSFSIPMSLLQLGNDCKGKKSSNTIYKINIFTSFFFPRLFKLHIIFLFALPYLSEFFLLHSPLFSSLNFYDHSKVPQLVAARRYYQSQRLYDSSIVANKAPNNVFKAKLFTVSFFQFDEKLNLEMLNERSHQADIRGFLGK